ncbi:MAG: ABC transporter ATP-binding protein [Chloroflexota bacterium]
MTDAATPATEVVAGAESDRCIELAGVKVTVQARRGLMGSVAVVILRGVSLSIARGETLAVVGESGSGKTTLGRATLRLAPIAAGRVIFEGEDITRLSEGRLRAFRRRAQAVFQDPYGSLSPYMRVRDLVAEPLVVQGVGDAAERRERIVAALESVRIRPALDWLDRYPHTLSGGQRQRVSIARAMVLEPDYVVADEPVSMVDASSRAEILGLLQSFQETRGVSYLYITHDLASARHVAARIAVMYLGGVVELGSARDVIERPLHHYTVELLAAVPDPDPANRHRLRPVVAGEPPSVASPPAGCAFHPRCPAFMRGICDVIDPLVEVAPGRQVACHLHPAPGGAATAVSPQASAPQPDGPSAR